MGVENTTYRGRNFEGSKGVINAGEEVAAMPGAGGGNAHMEYVSCKGGQFG